LNQNWQFFKGRVLPPEPSVKDVLPPREAAAESHFAEAEMEPEIEAAPNPTPRIIHRKETLIARKWSGKPKARESSAAAKQEVLQFEPLTRVVLKRASRQLWKVRTWMCRRFCARTCG